MQLNFADKHKVFIQPIQFSSAVNGCETNILRLDAIHPTISGNKFFKLQLHIAKALAEGYTTIATFGGAYSNHIVACACACKEIGMQSIGIIRGEEPQHKSNTLLLSASFGMQLKYVSREYFKGKEAIKNSYKEENYYWINEGGYSCLGAEGAKDICNWIDETYTDIVCAVGTGTMMAGLVAGSLHHQKITGISVLKGANNLQKDMEALLRPSDLQKDYELIDGYHFGGYAKHPKELNDWMNSFYRLNEVPTDIVYTAKLCYAVNDLLLKGYFKPNSKLMLIHSGGLQGNLSLPVGTLIFNT